MKFLHVFLALRNNQKYIVSAILLYLFFLIYSLPASFALLFIQLPKNIVLSSVSGTVWSGQARQVKYSSVNFGLLKWQIQPLHMLTGKLAANISLRNGKQFIRSEISIGLSGAIELEETRFLIDIESLQPLTYGMPFSYAGQLAGDFPVSFIHKNHYLQFTGQLELNDLKLTSPQAQSFGDINIDFSAQKDGSSSAQIKDAGGPLSISGKLSLNKNARLTLAAKLSARETGGSLDQLISILGKKDQSGRVQLNTQFQL